MKEEDLTRSDLDKTVLASDQYWGSYIGKFVGWLRTSFGISVQVVVYENVEWPSQHAIIFKDNCFKRKPYEYGRIVNFSLFNVQLFDTAIPEGGIDLEDILKRIVGVALEAKLGYKVDISNSEWGEAKRETLNDIYANNFCFFANVSSGDYFTNTMVNVLAVMKKVAA